MRVIKLPCYNIIVNIDGNSGVIFSLLHESEVIDGKGDKYEAAIDALESLILAHAVAGINIKSPAYIEGIETAVDAIANNL